LLGETSELSLEPAIEGRSNRSICDFSSGVAKKYVGAESRRRSFVLNSPMKKYN
jgi:hypothetical protein